MKGRPDDHEHPNTPLRAQLRKTFTDAYLCAVSPEGGKLSIYSTSEPLTTFKIASRARPSVPRMAKDEALRVIDMGSWKEVYSKQLRGKPLKSSFFPDSKTLYAETLPIPPSLNTSQRIIIDLETSHTREHLQTLYPGKPIFSYTSLDDHTLLGTETNSRTGTDALTRVSVPDYQEIARTSFAITPDREPWNRDTDVLVAANRKMFAYAVGHSLVTRRCEDLGILWTAQIEPDLFGVRALSITPDGSRVAAAIVDTTAVEFQHRCYVDIYDGKNGSQRTRLPLNGSQDIGISPDGKLLAVGQRFQIESDIQLSIRIYEIASGRLIATWVHDRIPPGRFQNLIASFDRPGVEFTSDGKYLITSANNQVKIWAL